MDHNFGIVLEGNKKSENWTDLWLSDDKTVQIARPVNVRR